MNETIKNLAKAFVGESQARNRYAMYAKIAQKEGFEQIADIFLQTAEQEREHASWLMKLINQLKGTTSENLDELIIEAGVPTILKDTAQNLKAAIAGENHEYTSMYPEFAAMAEKENLKDIAARLRSIAKAEAHHEERYKKLLAEVEKKTVFKKENKVYWICRKCGYMHEGTEPPIKCPSCDHPSNYFQVKSEEY